MRPKHKIDDCGTLLTATLRLVHSDGRNLPDMAVDTKVPFYWLRKFSSGNVKSPSVNRIQHLYEELSGKKLVIDD